MTAHLAEVEAGLLLVGNTANLEEGGVGLLVALAAGETLDAALDVQSGDPYESVYTVLKQTRNLASIQSRLASETEVPMEARARSGGEQFSKSLLSPCVQPQNVFSSLSLCACFLLPFLARPPGLHSACNFLACSTHFCWLPLDLVAWKPRWLT